MGGWGGGEAVAKGQYDKRYIKLGMVQRTRIGKTFSFCNNRTRGHPMKSLRDEFRRDVVTATYTNGFQRGLDHFMGVRNISGNSQRWTETPSLEVISLRLPIGGGWENSRGGLLPLCPVPLSGMLD